MAKAGFWLRGARGKLAGASLQKGEGGTIMREIVTPNNPKTLGQAIQRIAFSTAVRTARALKMIVDHSFEGVKYGETSVRHFTKMAAPVIKAALLNPYTYNGVKLVPAIPLGNIASAGQPAAAAGFMISSGTLPGMGFTLLPMHEGDPTPWAENAIRPDDYFTQVNATFTLENLLANGFNINDQVTIVGLVGGLNVTNPAGKEFFSSQLTKVVRFNFRKDVALNTPLFVAGDSANEFKLNTAVLDLERCSNATKLIFNANRTINYDGSGWLAASIILSRYVDGDWRRSTSYLQVPIDMETVTEGTSITVVENKSGLNNLDELIQAYLAGGTSEGDRYLNQEVNSDVQYNPAEDEEEEPEP